MWTIKNAENEVVTIDTDYDDAVELQMFLNEVADISGAGANTISETTQSDIDELSAQET
jgi:hypothetical protein